jgi:CheY-like chemotaxis protein
MRLLFIDDELFFAAPYVTALEDAGWYVRSAVTVEEALEAIRNDSEIAAVVLDIMMPPPLGVSAETCDHGLTSGIFFLESAAPHLIAKQLPVLILTNGSRDRVDAAIRVLALPDGLVEVRQKIETPRFYLPKAMQRLVHRWLPM